MLQCYVIQAGDSLHLACYRKTNAPKGAFLLHINSMMQDNVRHCSGYQELKV